MPRALFLFNHDAAHQVAHLAPVAAALSREHRDIETVVAYAGPAIRARIEGLIETADADRIRWIELRLEGLFGLVAKAFDRWLPASRLARLRRHEDLFERSDAVISTERTCLRVQARLGQQRSPLFIRVPHGTGDRSVTFHPDHRRFDLSLVAGAKMAAQLADHGIDPAKIRITGYSKFERIDLDAKPDLFDNGRPTFVYNPHFDPHLSSWYDAGPGLLRWFASEEGQQFNLIFAPHVMLFRKTTHISPEYRIAKRRPDVPTEALVASNIIVDVDGPRLFDMTYLLAADAYIGDASSQIYEFLVKQRAAYFLDPNGALGRQGPSQLPFLKTGARMETVGELTCGLSEWENHAKAHARSQRDLIDQTFALSEIPASSRAAQAIADAIAARNV